ncbi:cytochrome protein [Aulographum hederae CBS 113979]|uniref:Cytochrome protein n=1 Tax=Aulographum hederae CBS 113979 TaxID=1176131 RepID=A0A6G1H707_9PEZI|nr:cytochrome protein [Aulographum hederae CBS 113979]
MQTLVLIAVGAVAFFVIAERIRIWRLHRLTRANNCLSISKAKQSPFLFGIDWLRDFSKSAVEHRVLEHHLQEHVKYGNTFSVETFGSTVIHTSEPEYLKAILGTQFSSFDLGPSRHRAFSPLLGDGIFTISGPAWSHARRIVKGNFTRHEIKSVLDKLEVGVQRLIKSISPEETIDLQPLFLKLTMDTSTDFLFGYSTAEHSYGKAFSEAFETAQKGMAVRARLGPINKLYTDKKFEASCGVIHSYVDDLIRKALHNRSSVGDERYVFLYELAKEVDDPKQLRDHLLNLLVAGRDTTAGLISISFFLLARHKDVWDKLQQEIASLEGQPPDFEQIKSMSYLSRVLKEVLRLYPVTPLIGREANKNSILTSTKEGVSPLFVQKGQRIALSIHAMHRRQGLYGSDAAEFLPSRWEHIRPQWSYLPFSGGNRICIGQQFALVEASYVIVRLLQTFAGIQSRDDEPFKETVGLTLASKNGTLVALFPQAV